MGPKHARKIRQLSGLFLLLSCEEVKEVVPTRELSTVTDGDDPEKRCHLNAEAIARLVGFGNRVRVRSRGIVGSNCPETDSLLKIAEGEI
jgi:hypothetical protein